MSERTGPGIGAAADGTHRFDGETVRRILERAVVEQHRLNNASADSYSLEELEEMAAEAGVSPEALRAAIEALPRTSPSAAARAANAADARRRGGFAAFERWIPGRSSAARRIVLASSGGVALVGLLLAFPVVAEVLFWGTLLSLLVLSVLVLLGASPF